MSSNSVLSAPASRLLHPLLPGLLLSIFVTAIAALLERVEIAVAGHPLLDALVIAIILGTAWRTFAPPSPRFTPGIIFSAKTLLEIAVVLLGASISAAAIAAAGPSLFIGIAATVGVSIALSYAVGRALQLGHRTATLVACGNSICGNSAIAAVAPVIGATGVEVASSIAFTAVLGVVVVLLMPLLMATLGLSVRQYGIFAGLTVYAVPQVIAATAPVAALSLQLGTLVKLVRVLMLGPVILGIALINGKSANARPGLRHLVPWFIIGFLVMMALRSFSLLPEVALAPIGTITTWLTVISMAALGLGVDIRVVGRSGGRVIAAGTLSLLVLGVLAYSLIHVLQIQ
ncbi:MAG: putative sulfate exporter family transporter [Devosia sp.]|nr:putative sulfate exporter family transporter [Devosia sp.]